MDDHGGRWPAIWPLVMIGLLAVGLQIQVIVPLIAVGLKLCPADLVAAVLAALLAFLLLRGDRPLPWRSRSLPFWVFAATIILGIAIVIGAQRLGFVSAWALWSKGLGWVMLITYLAAGLWIGAVLGDVGRRWVMLALVGAILAAGLLSAVVMLALAPVKPLPRWFAHVPLRGFVDNSNAFVFLLLTALALLLSHGWLSRPLLSTRLRAVLIGLCGVITLYTASRSGSSMMAVMLVLALAFRVLSLRALIQACAYGAAAFAILEGLRIGALWLVAPAQLASVNGVALILHDITEGSSDAERWNGYVQAVQLWLTAPVFGSGLGTFIETHLTQYGRPLVIHNTALWLLTETGLVGLATFLGLAWVLVRPLFPLRCGSDEDRAFRMAALLLVVTFALMSQVHELMYQRVLWLVLGVAVAVPKRKAVSPCVG